MPIEPKRRCVPKFAPERQVREHRDANGPVCVPMCARSSFRRALRNAKRGEDLGSEPHPDCWTEEIQIR
ncbi:MAG: hypothetical protein EGS39_01075 [Bifidobacterium bifidum]|nr:hypothetical protein [Bifidobacterium bifidum]